MPEPTDPLDHAGADGWADVGAATARTRGPRGSVSAAIDVVGCEDRAGSGGMDALTERMSKATGLGPLLAEAETVWRSRAEGSAAADAALPAWRPFEDAFPTFYQFTNRPPR